MFDIVSGLLVYTLAGFSSSYAAAASAARPAYVATDEFLYGYIWKVETPFHVALLSLAILIFSLVMLQGVFHKFTAYLGIVLGVVGVVGGLLGFFPVAVLWSLWFLATGIQLYRLDESLEDQR